MGTSTTVISTTTPSTTENNGRDWAKKESTEPPNEDRIIVKYRQQYYDITEFMRKHPGGLNTLRGLNQTDMTARFERAPPHSDAAMYLMQEYKIPTPIKTRATTTKTPTPRSSVNKILEGHGIQLIDELPEEENSMEHLVDWNKAMVPQIRKIKHHYEEWVHKPVDRPLRLFDQWYLEILTKTPWWLIPLFWLPIIAKCLRDAGESSWQRGDIGQLSYLTLIFFTGTLLWTLIEYCLHRYVFHMHVDQNSSTWVCTIHFIGHGLHHKVPYDPMRLVFPPVPGAALATLFYTPLSFMVPHPRALLAGALCGYLAYDMMHYYLHYGNPSISHLYNMKRYHYQHHFAHQQQGFGITSSLWDSVFNTKIRLRQLRYQLRWH